MLPGAALLRLPACPIHARMSRNKNPFSPGGRGASGRPGKDPQLVWRDAVAASKAGNHAQAEKLLRQFLKVSGPRPDVLRWLAIAQSQLGKHLEAIKSIERACKTAPDNTELLLTRGTVLLKAGQSREACKAFRRIIELKTEPSAPDHFHLGMALRTDGDLEGAKSSLATAVELDGSLTHVRHEYAATLAALGDNDTATRELRLCTEQDPNQLPSWLTLGSVERARGNHEAAIAAFDRAIALRPDFAPAYSNRGQTLRELGRIDESIASFATALQLMPDHGQARVMLAATRKYTERNAEVAWMEKAAAGKIPAALRGEMQIAQHDAQFAYSKMLGDLGDEDAAFRWLHKANASKRKTLDYDIESDLAVMRRLPESFTPEVLAAAAGAGGCEDPTPIFICGMPRSGTTLVESMLDAHPEIKGAGELMYLPRVCQADPVLGSKTEPLGAAAAPPESLLRVGTEYCRLARTHAPRALRIVDKMPLNSLRIGAIRRLLPNAKILCMRRDARDVGLSCYRTNFDVAQHFSYDLRELGRYHRAHDELLDYWAAHIGKDALYQVEYERLVDDFEAEIRRICEFLEIDWDERMLQFHRSERAVTTSSLEQVRNPIYRSSVGGWKRYEKELGPLLEALEAETRQR